MAITAETLAASRGEFQLRSKIHLSIITSPANLNIRIHSQKERCKWCLKITSPRPIQAQSSWIPLERFFRMHCYKTTTKFKLPLSIQSCIPERMPMPLCSRHRLKENPETSTNHYQSLSSALCSHRNIITKRFSRHVTAKLCVDWNLDTAHESNIRR